VPRIRRARAPQGTISMNKIFVGGLAWAVDSEGLRAAFSEFGEIIEAKVIVDFETGRSRGFGFVTFADADSAQRSLDMNGREIEGRPVRVDMASSNDQRGGRPNDQKRRGPRRGPNNY
jgi:cold-inducible RNA-binding protein